jgi:phosphosulfolactate synthase (CoM biosynthesis protein A)
MRASDASAPAGNEFGEEGLQRDEREHERERLVEQASAIHRDVDQGEHRVEPEAFAVGATIGPSSAPHVAPRRPSWASGR